MNVNVAGATRVVLPVKAASIKGTARVGNALEVYLANGNVITLENYFPNKPTLLTNEHDNTVAEFVINDDGTIEGVKALSADEAESLLGNGYASLSTSPNDILILTPNDTIGAVAAPSYDVAVFAASAALLAGAFILADRDSDGSNSNRTTETTKNDDGSTTTVTKEDTNGDGKVDKVTTETKDKDGNTTSTKTEETTTNDDGSTTTVTKEDTNGDGKVDKVTTETKDKDGNTTSTKTEETTTNDDGSTTTVTKEDTNGDGKVDKVTTETKDKDGNTTSTKTEETTTNDDGSTTTVTKEDTNGDGKVDKVTTETKDKDGNTTSTKTEETTTNDDGSTTTVTKEDTNGDGKVDKVTTETKDKDGNTTSTKTEDSTDLAPTDVDVKDNETGGSTVSGTTKPNADVTITDEQGNVIGTGKADDNGHFDIDVPKQNDGDKIGVEATDPQTGNTGSTDVTVGDNTATDLAPTDVDVKDNETGGSTVSGTTKPNADVTITDEQGNVIGTGKADDNGHFDIDVPKQNDGDKIGVEATDPQTGNTGSTDVTVGDNTATDLAPTDVDVKDNETGGSTVSGTTKPNADVTITDEQGNVIGTGKADDNGHFDIDVPKQNDGDKIGVEATDPQTGNTGSTDVTVGDNTATDLAPTDVDVKDNETGGSTVSGTTKPNADVTITDEQGNVIGTGKADDNGHFDIDVPKQNDGDKIGVEATDPQTGNTGSTDVTVGDNTATDLAPTDVDVKDNETGGSTVSGTTKPNADVTITDEQGNVIGTGKADDNGHFDIDVPKQNDGDKIGVEATDPQTGNTGSTDVTVGDNTATDLAPTDVDVKDNETGGSTVSGTTKPNADVTITDEKGDVIGTGKADDNGHFDIDVPKQNDGDKIGVEATDPQTGNTGSTDVTVGDNTATDLAPTDVDVKDNETGGSTVSGTTKPNADVTITDEQGNVIGTGKADDNGHFDIDVPKQNDGDKIGVEATDPQTGNTGSTDVTVGDNTATDLAPTDVDVKDNETGGSTVSGTTKPNADVTITDEQGNVIGTGKADDNGHFDIDVPKQNDGDKIGVEATDPQTGNTGSTDVTVGDNTATDLAPTDVDVKDNETGGSTVSGTTKPNADVTITDEQGNVIGTGKADDNGHFDIDVPKQNDGDKIGVEATDPQTGNTGSTDVTVDTTAPVAPTETAVSPDGTEVTGKAEPGSTVTLKDDQGNVIGSAKADDNGDFTIPVNPPKTNGETLTAEATDASGNTSPVATVTAPDTTAPVAPTETAVSPDGTAVTGKAEPGSTVTLKDDQGNVIGSAKADDNGDFTIPVNPPKTNGETLSVEATDSAGNTSPVATTTAPTVDPTTPDTTAPVAPTETAVSPDGTEVTGKAEPGSTVTLKDDQGNVIGSAKADDNGDFTIPVNPPKTNGETLTAEATDASGNTSPVATVTAPDTTAPVAPTETAVSPDGTAVTGKAEPGSTVTVKDDQGNVIGSAKADDNGDFTIPVNPPKTNGETLTAEATDASGNTSPVATVTAPDTTAPVAPTETAVSPDGTAVTGKAEPGSTVTLKDDQGNVIGSAKADDNGDFTIPVNPPKTNGETLSVEATDSAGNTSPVATTTAPTVDPTTPDTTAPVAPTETAVSPDGTEVTGKAEPGSTVTLKDDQGNVIGSAKADDNGDFTIPVNPPKTNGETLTAEATDASGNTSPVATVTAPDTTAPVAPTETAVSPDGTAVTGKAEPGSTVTVKDDQGNVIGSAKADDNGDFTVPVNPPKTNGETLNVEATDPAGNTSPVATTTAPDTTAPVAPTETAVNPNGTAVTGKAEPGSTVTVKDPTGKVLGSAKADDNGDFTVPVSPAQKNGETLSVDATDPAGNKSPVATATAPDTTAPTAPTNVAVNPTGTAVTGKAEPGATVTVKDDQGKVLGSAKADDNGNFSVPVSPAKTNGETLTAEATDPAGNKSPVATVTAPDTTAPEAPTNVDYDGLTITGEAEPGSVVKIKSPDGTVLGSTTANENGKFEVTLSELPPENVQVTATDEAGNESDATPLAIDLSEPDVAFIVDGKLIYTYYDINYDGIVDRAEVATYDKDVQVDAQGKVTNDAKVVQIDSYLEGTDIAGGKGAMATVQAKENLPLTDADQKTYFTYDSNGNVKQRLYDLDAKSSTGETVTGTDGKSYQGIDKFETVIESRTINGVAVEAQVAYNNDAKDDYDAKSYFQYDAKGQRTLAFYDDNADGKIDRAERYTYDDNGNVIRIDYDNDANGVRGNTTDGLTHSGTGIDKVEYFTYEAKTVTVNGEDVVKYLNTAKYTNSDAQSSTGSTYTINGQQVQGIDSIEKNTYNDLARLTKIEYDNNGDGTTDKIHYQQFDGVGRVVKVLVDADAKTGTGKAQPDGSGGTARGIDQVVAYELNVKGEVVSQLTDNNVDGAYDVREVSVLDANGNVVETQYDKTNDGKIDSVTKNTLNAKGEVIEAKYYNQAENGTQTLTSRNTFERDANGHVTKKVSYSASGDISVAETYTNDAQGRVLKKLIDNYGDGNIDRAEIYTLDANGYIAKTENDIGNDGTINSNVTYERDALGRIVKYTTDSNNDGTPDTISISVYNEYNQVIQSKTDNGADGVIDGVTYNTYDANGRRISYWVEQQPIDGVQLPTDYAEQNVYNEYNQVTKRTVNNGNTTYDLYMEYNSDGQVSNQRFDYNRNGVMDGNDVRETIEYDSIWKKTSIITRYNQDGSVNQKADFEYNDSGALVRYYNDAKGDGTIEALAFGNYRGGGTVNHSEDMTTWSGTQLTRFGKALATVTLSDTAAKTEITLDGATVAALSKSGFDIRGDATDTVNLSSDFTKVEGTTKRAGTDVLQAYTADVDGATYTVYVDTDVNTVIA